MTNDTSDLAPLPKGARVRILKDNPDAIVSNEGRVGEVVHTPEEHVAEMLETFVEQGGNRLHYTPDDSAFFYEVEFEDGDWDVYERFQLEEVK